MTCLRLSPFLVRLLAAPEYLARHHELVATPAFLLEDLAHDDLRLPGGVGFRVVEEIDAAVERRAVINSSAVSWRDLLRESDPGAKREGADLQTGFSEAAIFHSGSIRIVKVVSGICETGNPRWIMWRGRRSVTCADSRQLSLTYEISPVQRQSGDLPDQNTQRCACRTNL